MHKQAWTLPRKRRLVIAIPGHQDVTIDRTEDDKIEVRAPEEFRVRRIDSEDDSIAVEPDTSVD